MIPVAFWSFRLMIGIGLLAALVAAVYLWTSRRGREPHRLLLRRLPLIPLLPAAGNTFGWIFTETARQPWLAFGISKVADGISPGLTRGEVIASLIGFTVVYGVVAVVWLRLIRHLSRQPLAPAEPEAAAGEPTPVY
jgi:cytochrome d ubiquinol oxidase subunit I